MQELLVGFVGCVASQNCSRSQSCFRCFQCRLMFPCNELLVNMCSSARLTRPKEEPDPLLQEPSVYRTRLSIILTAALDLVFFFLTRQLQAALNSFTCTFR